MPLCSAWEGAFGKRSQARRPAFERTGFLRWEGARLFAGFSACLVSGQPLSKKHIPEIALVTAPDYLCSVDRTGKAHMDKFDLGLMYEQLHTFVRCIEILDGMTRKEIGRSQPYSLGLGRLK